jgi:hypothetical protein
MKTCPYLSQALDTLARLSPQEPVIFVAVPHQQSPEVFGFDSREEFDRWLWRFPPLGYDLQLFAPEAWAERREERAAEGLDDAQNEAIDREGLRLFAVGARKVAEARTSDCSPLELLPDVDDAAHLLRCSAEPYHAVYLLSREDTCRLLAGDPAGPRLSHHQFYEVRQLVDSWATQLSWKEAGA